jgi:hypothetical protein
MLVTHFLVVTTCRRTNCQETQERAVRYAVGVGRDQQDIHGLDLLFIRVIHELVNPKTIPLLLLVVGAGERNDGCCLANWMAIWPSPLMPTISTRSPGLIPASTDPAVRDLDLHISRTKRTRLVRPRPTANECTTPGVYLIADVSDVWIGEGL